MSYFKMLLKTSTAIALGAFVAAGAAVAQDAAPAPADPAPMQAPVADLTDDKLQSFAVAFLEVSRISQTYQGELQGATQEDQQGIQQEAGQKMIEAVNNSDGINVDEYNQIIAAAQADPELAQRINTHINQAAGGAAQQPDGGAAPAPEPAQ